MRLIMGIHLTDDQVVVVTGTAASVAGSHPGPPHLSSHPARLYWPATAAPRWSRPADNPDDVYGHFLTRIADLTAVRTASGRGRAPHQLVTAALHVAIDATERSDHGHVVSVAIAHPPHWSAEQIGMLRRAAGRAVGATTIVSVVSECAAISRCVRWSAQMGTADLVADHPSFLGAWGAAMLAATAVTRVPVPTDRTARRPVRTAPAHRMATITHPMRRIVDSSVADLRLRWNALGHA